MLNRFYNINHIIILTILCGLIWWSCDFFLSDSFLNNGDTVFQFFPEEAVKNQLLKWDENLAAGFGREQLFSVSILFDAFFSLLRWLGIPLWILNRLWMVLPTLFFGASLLYLFERFRFQNNYKTIGSFFALAYIMLSPRFTIAPIIYIALASFVFIFTKFIDIFRAKYISIRDITKISIFSLFLLGSIRSLFFLPVFIFIYFCCYFFVFRKSLSRQFIYKLLLCVIVLILMNAYTILPIVNKISNSGTVTIDPFAYENRVGMIEDFFQKGMFAPLNVLRLLDDRNNPQLSYYFNHGVGAILSFIFPLFITVVFMKKRIKKELFVLALFTQILFFLSVITYFPSGLNFFKILRKIIPGVWIHHPSYFVTFYSIFAGILLGIIIQEAFIWSRKELGAYPSIKFSGPFVACLTLFIMVFCHGRNVIVDYYPVKGIFGNFMYGNHNKYFKIPNSYTELRNYLSINAKNGYRLLNLPIVEESYSNYTWYPYNNMPELVSSFSPIPVMGCNPVLMPLLKELRGLKSSPKLLPKLIPIMKLAETKYIIVHKDYTRSGFFQQGIYSKYLIELFSRNDNFEIAIDNRNFVLFRLKEAPNSANKA